MFASKYYSLEGKKLPVYLYIKPYYTNLLSSCLRRPYFVV